MHALHGAVVEICATMNVATLLCTEDVLVLCNVMQLGHHLGSDRLVLGLDCTEDRSEPEFLPFPVFYVNYFCNVLCDV